MLHASSVSKESIRTDDRAGIVRSSCTIRRSWGTWTGEYWWGTALSAIGWMFAAASTSAPDILTSRLRRTKPSRIAWPAFARRYGLERNCSRPNPPVRSLVRDHFQIEPFGAPDSLLSDSLLIMSRSVECKLDSDSNCAMRAAGFFSGVGGSARFRQDRSVPV
jgi:hypothetical protein